jgi:hypothetical protein
LTPAETEFVQAALARLEKIAQQAAPGAARYCDRILACFYFQMAMLDDMPAWLPKVESHARLIVEADAKDQDAADVLEFALTEQGKSEAGLDVAKKRAAGNPTARNRYLLARSLAYCDQPDAAAAELKAALALEPLDPYCLAGRAALLLRDGTQADAWRDAAKDLGQARASIKPGERKQLSEDIEFLDAICHALLGQPIFARATLDRLLRVYPRASEYRAALDALGP